MTDVRNRRRRALALVRTAHDPNTVERAASYVSVAELLDPRPTRLLTTRATVPTSSPDVRGKETDS